MRHSRPIGETEASQTHPLLERHYDLEISPHLPVFAFLNRSACAASVRRALYNGK